MDLTTLSNDDLLKKVLEFRHKEKEATLAILYHLIEIERRGLYRELGHSSMFDYLTKRLGYSEGSAQRRIVASRCIGDNPELGTLFIEGKVTLCNIACSPLFAK